MQYYPNNKSNEISIVAPSDTVAQVDAVMIESQRASTAAKTMIAGFRDEALAGCTVFLFFW